MSRVIALLACHNRKDQTVACLASLLAQPAQGTEIDVILVDDGSTDGTAAAARSLSDRIEVITADGSLYWAGAMALAERRAIERQPDYVLWLNDDVVLDPRALETLISATDPATERRLVVGSLIDPETGVPTYGGLDRTDWHPLRFELVPPGDHEPREVTTFNGNVVLVPRAAYHRLGGIDGGFSHAYADLDYGVRARALGFNVVTAGPAVGTCARQPIDGTWRDPCLPLLSRYRLMLDRKGAPIASSVRYLRRHGGHLWPLYVSATYLKLPVIHAAWRLQRRLGRHREAG